MWFLVTSTDAIVANNYRTGSTVNEDDLGDPNGCTYFPFSAEARHKVLGWRPVAVGRRPVDFIARDFLLGSLARDGRLWQLKKAWRNMPSWTTEDTSNFSARERKVILAVRVLHYFHAMQLFNLLQTLKGEAATALCRLLACWPYGIEVGGCGKNGGAGPRDVCRQPKICPWCAARHLVSLYRRLRAGPVSDRPDRILALGSVTVSDGALSSFDDDESARDRVRWLKDTAHGFLRESARRIGATGGIVTFQIGPQKETISQWQVERLHEVARIGLSYRASILCECSAEGARALRAGMTGGPELLIDGIAHPVDWVLRSGPQALRVLLAGTATRSRYGSRPRGLRGAFVLNPWFLASSEQWLSHLYGTRSSRLYSPWGTWVEGLAPQAGGLLNANRRRGRHRRDEAFRHANAERGHAALARRTECVAVCAPIWKELSAKLGRRPGRRELGKALATACLSVSERDVRWLVTRFTEDPTEADHDVLGANRHDIG